jgi:stage V sporulation protein R
MKKAAKRLPQSSDWTFKQLYVYADAIGKVANEVFHLETFPIQLEIISAEQMMDVYSTVGMPLGYHHWSFGKQFVNIEKSYQQGYINLAYEIVINSNPCIAYLLEENTMTMQATIIAHACYGHNSFFKNNYLFQTWTDPDSIIDYLMFAKSYIADCEERYGITTVEEILDSCHALMNYGVNRYKRPPQLSLQEEKARQKAREAYLQSQVNDLWRTIPESAQRSHKKKNENRFPSEPQENLLYFIEKNAPLLEPWQREIVRIVRKIAQYFYPQRQTKVMNEGWASFWHYTLLNHLYDEKKLSDKFMLEFIHNHTNLLLQPAFDSPHFSGLNPYTLGFHIFSDIRRICEYPTDEDKKWFPNLANTNWLNSLDFAMRNYKDESFIAQYLSPKVIRDLKLFSLADNDKNPDFIIDAIHNPDGYPIIRQTLAEQYNINNNEPNIEVYSVNVKGDRSIILHHKQYQRRLLSKETEEVLKHFHYLWKFDVTLITLDEKDQPIKEYHCPLPLGEALEIVK